MRGWEQRLPGCTGSDFMASTYLRVFCLFNCKNDRNHLPYLTESDELIFLETSGFIFLLTAGLEDRQSPSDTPASCL